MCSYNNILTKRKHQFHARSQKSGSKLLAPTVPNQKNAKKKECDFAFIFAANSPLTNAQTIDIDSTKI